MPQRLNFTRGYARYTQANDNYECIIYNNQWINNIGGGNLYVDGSIVRTLNICPNDECLYDNLTLRLQKNLSGELKLVVTETSHCMCWWYENVGYGTPPEDFTETSHYRMVEESDSSDESEDEEEEDEEEVEDEDEPDEEDPASTFTDIPEGWHLQNFFDPSGLN